MEDSTRETPNKLLLTNGFNRQNLKVGKSASRAKSHILRNIPQAPAPFTGKSIPDFENLDFKIASGLRKILTGHFKKQVTTAEGKGRSEKRSVTGRQTVWMIYDFYKIGGDNGAIMDFSYFSTFQIKNDSVQAFETKWDEGFSAVNERPTDNMLEILCKM